MILNWVYVTAKLGCLMHDIFSMGIWLPYIPYFSSSKHLSVIAVGYLDIHIWHDDAARRCTWYLGRQLFVYVILCGISRCLLAWFSVFIWFQKKRKKKTVIVKSRGSCKIMIQELDIRITQPWGDDKNHFHILTRHKEDVCTRVVRAAVT